MGVYPVPYPVQLITVLSHREYLYPFFTQIITYKALLVKLFWIFFSLKSKVRYAHNEIQNSVLSEIHLRWVKCCRQREIFRPLVEKLNLQWKMKSEKFWIFFSLRRKITIYFKQFFLLNFIHCFRRFKRVNWIHYRRAGVKLSPHLFIKTFFQIGYA